MKRLIKLAKALSSMGFESHAASIMKVAEEEEESSYDKLEMLRLFLMGDSYLLSKEEASVFAPRNLEKFIEEMGGVIKPFPIEKKISKYSLIYFSKGVLNNESGPETFVLDWHDLEDKKLTTQEWCESIDPDKYIENINFDIPSEVFHATREENREDILEEGLQVRSDSRGISNRHLPDAVFTSAEPEEISNYGSLLLKIDLGRMLSDGIISKENLAQEPDVERYEKNRILEHIFKLEDGSLGFDMEGGMSPNTIIIYSSVPPEYITIESE
jgi:hypothetical protein